MAVWRPRSGRFFSIYLDFCPKGLLCRGAPKIDVCASVRPTVRPSVRGRQNGPDLVTRYWVFALVTPSSVTNSGSVRDAFDLVTRNCFWALVTRSSVTKSERFWSESWTGPDFWSLSTQKALRATLPCWCYLVTRKRNGFETYLIPFWVFRFYYRISIYHLNICSFNIITKIINNLRNLQFTQKIVKLQL